MRLNSKRATPKPKPLPLIPGPKLLAYNGGLPVDLTFLECIYEAGHSNVWKVSIDGSVFALKVFKFQFFQHLPPWSVEGLSAKEQLEGDQQPDPLKLQNESFFRECRAYGRLREAGREDIAVKCHGYLMLNQQQEDWLKEQGNDFHREEADTPATPLRALVKDFVQSEVMFTRPMVRSMMRNLQEMHRLGIVNGDIKAMNYVDGHLVDFSSATTVPHDELDGTPRKRREAMDSVLYDLSMFDAIVDEWNAVHHPREKIWLRFEPSEDFIRRLRKGSYEFRAKHNPLDYDWKSANSSSRLKEKKQDKRKGKVVKRKRRVSPLSNMRSVQPLKLSQQPLVTAAAHGAKATGAIAGTAGYGLEPISVILTKANPILQVMPATSLDNTTSQGYAAVDYSDVVDWADFTLLNIKAMLRDLLSAHVKPSTVGEPSDSQSNICGGEESVDTVVDKWCVEVVRPALKHGAEHIQRSTRAKQASIHPDWTVHQEKDRVKIVLLATYCKATETRYGFLITPDELVACRFHQLPDASKLGVHYKAVPWENHGRDKMTVNLAIWALSMLAVDPEQRKMVAEDALLPLNSWHPVNADGTGGFSHYLTRQILQSTEIPEEGRKILKPRPTTRGTTRRRSEASQDGGPSKMRCRRRSPRTAKGDTALGSSAAR
ncbi:hypothetical protein G7046_g9649 [Stylonectria norvegica]|nr:hypothetical protein G7046_g9649 [Stylonectria norvegica]